MQRYTISKGPIDCAFVTESEGKPISLVSFRDHNIDAASAAFHLSQAAAWFRRVAEGKIEPDGNKTRKQLRKFSPGQTA